MRPLNILHVLRAPVGGLFRHVVDLARGQTALGHRVGLVADATTGAARAEAALATLSFDLEHGVLRIPMDRHLGLADLAAQRAVALHAKACGAEIVHGHGAKGGAYARLLPAGQAVRVYTPHGGSLHYRRASPLGLLYLSLERVLMPRTELLLFESAYSRDMFYARVGAPAGKVAVVHNGVSEAEFQPVTPAAGASDVVFVGELRMLKGVDVLIDALAALAREGETVSATIVGDGPDAGRFKERARAAGLAERVRFPGAMPARAAFAQGRLLVVPSRAESLPYVVLEAAAAGVPQIATAVGGVSEIFGPLAPRLVAPGDPAALGRAIRAARAAIEATRADATQLQTRVRELFSAEAMTKQILAAYGESLG
jgi:glycosyltransferase involved in cell wall biosynthesis